MCNGYCGVAGKQFRLSESCMFWFILVQSRLSHVWFSATWTRSPSFGDQSTHSQLSEYVDALPQISDREWVLMMLCPKFQIESDTSGAMNEERESRLFPDPEHTDSQITCHLLTPEFLIFGTQVRLVLLCSKLWCVIIMPTCVLEITCHFWLVFFVGVLPWIWSAVYTLLLHSVTTFIILKIRSLLGVAQQY